MNIQERIEKMAAEYIDQIPEGYAVTELEVERGYINGAQAAVKLLAEGSGEHGPRVWVSYPNVWRDPPGELCQKQFGPIPEYCPVTELTAAKARIAELEAAEAKWKELRAQYRSQTAQSIEVMECAQAELEAVKAERDRMRAALGFYATYQPRQHPEGYYEMHVAPGEGGEVRFGTFARKILAETEAAPIEAEKEDSPCP